MNFLEKLSQTAQQAPSKIALAVSMQEPSISYANLDILSGRVLSYLNKHGIGKEDFVAICLPRGAEPLICAVGVLKAGAAFVLIEENYTPERAAFIRQDCNCKLLIDYAVWQEIQHEQPASITAPWDDHAAAFAIYTSGSTGAPKGVVHEYGNIEKISVSTTDIQWVAEDAMALIAPLTFVVSLMAFFSLMFAAATLYIVPYAVVKNPQGFYVYLIENCISVVFLPPSIFNMFPNFGPHMRAVLLGGEQAIQTYKEGVRALNVYSMSEVGAVVCYFQIDKSYDVTPIGTPTIVFDIYLLDEDGNQVVDGEIGELCVHVPFVRGYLNRPKENEIAFRKGNIYHTGDLAYKQPDGNYVVRGRIDDMIKINGNRIEPGEIAAVVKKVLDLDWACAKGFLEGDSGFVCVYYTKDIDINYDETRKKLINHLPYYMLPSHFIKLDSMPLNANGKLDRKALMPPVKEAAGKEDYVAPTNDLEAQLCKAFEKALQIDKIGIQDDFYILGGDSLKAMTVLTLCKIEGLTISEIFRGRTPEKIAKLCSELNANATAEDMQDALNRSFLLTPEQLYMVDYQLYVPKSTMYNLSVFSKLDSQIDADKFAGAVSKTIARHPALLTVFGFNEDGEMIQHYDSTFAKTIAVECVSESELSILKDTLIYPYKIVGEPLYRCRIFKTEKSLYFFFDVHHTVFDGTSFGVLLHDINALYKGETELQRDCYYELLTKNIRATRSTTYKEGLDYFKNRYGKQSYNMLEPYANKSSANRVDLIETLLPKIENIRIMSASTQQPLSNNVVFLAITAVALSSHCKTSQVEFLWIYNGRSSLEQMQTAGLLFSILPINVQLPRNLKFTELLEDIKEQVSLGIQYEYVHYIAAMLQSKIDDYSISMLCQDGIYDFDTLCGKPVESIPIKNPYAAAQSALDISIFRSENGTALQLEFNSGKFDKLFMEGLMNSYEQIVKKLASYSDLSEITINDLTCEQQ